MDRFVTPEPVLKKLITKSSIDIVKDIRKPTKIPGIIWGNITFSQCIEGGVALNPEQPLPNRQAFARLWKY